MPEFQATCHQGVIDRVIAPDEDTAAELFKKHITAGRFPYLYKLWKKTDFAVKESKKPLDGGSHPGAGK